MIPLLVSALAMTAPVTRFALIVTYNGGPELSRPPLHYADDDGAKYFEVFAALDQPENVELLTEFDDDSARLFSALSKRAQPPTLTNVQTAAGSLRERVQAARQHGYATELTFVFAGHGDVVAGKGFVSLKGGPLDGDGLTALLQTVGADRSHVILDSCNSFFVLSPRGRGRRFATPADLSDRLTRQMPNVGVFLSTNAEAEVFEWSELQSGVFSHAVRSGLLGAADANGDGVVSYEELEAFVDTATRDVKNPLFRPKVFSRGPGGDNSAELVSESQGDTVPLTVDEPGELRLSIRDAQGLRWIDAHKEAGARLVLRLPPFLAADGSVERVPHDGRGPRTRLLLADHGGAPLELSRLGDGGPPLSARGDSELLQALWGSPFGPHAVAAWKLAQATQPVPVFGIDANEKLRMHLLLAQISEAGRDRRLTGAVTDLAAAVALGVLTGVANNAFRLPATDGPNLGQAVIVGGCATLATVGAVVGIGTFFIRSDEEKAAARWSSSLDAPHTDPGLVVAEATAELERIAARDREIRRMREGFAWALAGFGAVDLVFGLALPSADLPSGARQLTVWTGGLAIGIGLIEGLVTRFGTTPEERLIKIWEEDPDRLQVTGIGVAPVPGGKGAALVLGGRF